MGSYIADATEFRVCFAVHRVPAFVFKASIAAASQCFSLAAGTLGTRNVSFASVERVVMMWFRINKRTSRGVRCLVDFASGDGQDELGEEEREKTGDEAGRLGDWIIMEGFDGGKDRYDCVMESTR